MKKRIFEIYFTSGVSEFLNIDVKKIGRWWGGGGQKSDSAHHFPVIYRR
jgi:hypothetical protein